MEDLAERTGGAIRKGVIANVETGRKNELTVPQLFAFADALRVPPLALLVDFEELDDPAAVDVVDESGTLRSLTNIGFIRWVAGTRPVDVEDDEQLPAEAYASRALAAIHELVAREEQYAASLAAYGVGEGKSDIERSLLLQRVQLAQEGVEVARQRARSAGVSVQRKGGHDGTTSHTSE